MSMIPFHSDDLLRGLDLSDPFKSLFQTLDALPRVSNFMNTDVSEEGGNIKVSIDLPGVKKENIEMKLVEGTLVICASTNENKSTEEKSETVNYIRKERYSGKYTRNFYVGKSITSEDIKAKFENGVLYITFPKEKTKELPSNNIISIQ